MMRKYLKNRFIVYQFELLHAYKLLLASKYSDWPSEREIGPALGGGETLAMGQQAASG